MFKLFYCVILGLIVFRPSSANSMIELSKGVYFEQIVTRISDEASFVIETQPYHLADSDNVEKILEEFSVKYHLSLQSQELEFPDHLGNYTHFKKFSITLGRSLDDVNFFSKELLSKGIQVQELLKCVNCKHRANQVISVVKVDPKLFTGRILSSLADQSVAGLATVSKSDALNSAMVSINGNFFVMNSKLGLPGDISGIAVKNGKLLSEAVDNRPALIINNAEELKASIAHTTRTKIFLHKENNKLVIHGLNRLPNKILNCGNFQNGEYQFPVHDVVCTNKNELIAFTNEFGKFDILEQFDGDIYIFNDRLASLSRVEQYPSQLNDYETLLLATGNSKKKLAIFYDSHAGEVVRLSYHVFADGKELHLKKGMFIIGGGPTLLLNSKVPLADWYQQGWHISSHKTAFEGQDTTDFESNNVLDRSHFYNSWVFGNHPRTSVGVDALGNIYFFTVYGRNSYLSQGMGLIELANLMKSKGIVNAINLDGGGSTTMVVNGRLTGVPSDSTGERQVADVISIVSN